MKDLTNYITQFQNWSKEKSNKASEWEEERTRRELWYKEKLSPNRINDLTVDDFSIMIKELWASSVWTNKNYKIQYLLENNGFDKIKQELKELLYGEDLLENRWDNFKHSIKGLGPSSISEILTFFDPQKYGLINLKIYKVLPHLGIKIHTVKDGKGYKEALEGLSIVRDALRENGMPDADFIITDFFIAYLFYEVFDLAYERKTVEVFPSEEEKLVEKSIETLQQNQEKKEIIFEDLEIESHEEAEAILLLLGNLLGFDTYTPDKSKEVMGQNLGDIATLNELSYFGSETIMDSAQHIDVVWVKDEWPEYFFEVENTTGVTDGLLRIYRVAAKLSAKCFIIAPPDKLNKFQKEIEKPPFKPLKERFKFRSYAELKEMYLSTQTYMQISHKFLDEK
ncbi:MAG: hypothetical protein PHO28_01555 [Candidatus Pacebacteria bacterium]|nr:hypothetical protein [Candidatus Paceibacterota bacterium]